MKTNPRGKLLMSNKELEYYRKNFVESALLFGRIGNLYQVDQTIQVDTDYDYKYKAPVEVAYALIENPSKSLLQKHDWYVENPQNKPIIATLTFYDIDDNKIYPSEGAILEISTRSDPHNLEQFETKKFDIVAVNVDYDLALFNCNLAPHRDKLRPQNPVATPDDIYVEQKFFNKKDLSIEDLRWDF